MVGHFPHSIIFCFALFKGRAVVFPFGKSPPSSMTPVTRRVRYLSVQKFRNQMVAALACPLMLSLDLILCKTTDVD